MNIPQRGERSKGREQDAQDLSVLLSEMRQIKQEIEELQQLASPLRQDVDDLRNGLRDHHRILLNSIRGVAQEVAHLEAVVKSQAPSTPTSDAAVVADLNQRFFALDVHLKLIRDVQRQLNEAVATQFNQWSRKHQLSVAPEAPEAEPTAEEPVAEAEPEPTPNERDPLRLVLFDTKSEDGRQALQSEIGRLQQVLEDSARAAVMALEEWYTLLLAIHEECSQEQEEEGHWTQRDILARLDRELFAWKLEPAWDEVSAYAAQDREEEMHSLRECEESVRSFAQQVRHDLFKHYGVRPLEIVLGRTQFNPAQHESSDYLSRPAPGPEQSNIICEVERRGYEYLSLDHQSTVLMLARVGRFTWRAPQALPPEPEDGHKALPFPAAASAASTDPEPGAASLPGVAAPQLLVVPEQWDEDGTSISLPEQVLAGSSTPTPEADDPGPQAQNNDAAGEEASGGENSSEAQPKSVGIF